MCFFPEGISTLLSMKINLKIFVCRWKIDLVQIMFTLSYPSVCHKCHATCQKTNHKSLATIVFIIMSGTCFVFHTKEEAFAEAATISLSWKWPPQWWHLWPLNLPLSLLRSPQWEGFPPSQETPLHSELWPVVARRSRLTHLMVGLHTCTFWNISNTLLSILLIFVWMFCRNQWWHELEGWSWCIWQERKGLYLHGCF